jgi:hypothetical protein
MYHISVPSLYIRSPSLDIIAQEWLITAILFVPWISSSVRNESVVFALATVLRAVVLFSGRHALCNRMMETLR